MIRMTQERINEMNLMTWHGMNTKWNGMGWDEAQARPGQTNLSVQTGDRSGQCKASTVQIDTSTSNFEVINVKVKQASKQASKQSNLKMLLIFSFHLHFFIFTPYFFWSGLRQDHRGMIKHFLFMLDLIFAISTSPRFYFHWAESQVEISTYQR
jgi:hypothetical protein